MYHIIQADILDWAKEYNGLPFHALLCDSPYHLISQVKRFGSPDSKPPKGDVYRRSIGGMMGQTWDGLDETGKGIAFKPETWAALAEHLYPGAFIMSFAGTRGYHRMACAMEDAGLIIHPAMGWLQCQGFPKATRVDSQIARLAKIEGVPTLIKTWAGHRYGLQTLKPSFEFLAVAQKPYAGRPVDSIVETGAGALNIEQSRIPGEWHWGTQTNIRGGGYGNKRPSDGDIFARDIQSHPAGRWPANFLLTCSCDPSRPDPAVHDDTCPVAMLDRQSGELKSGELDYSKHKDRGQRNLINGLKGHNRTGMYEANSGPASRMFHRADFAYEVAEQLANAEPIKYEPKSSTAERNAGLEGNNPHPTLKPLSLTKYLATLLSPPVAYAPRRILIPFSGTGSEIIGAILSGCWEEIVGIEREKSYVKIAEARCKWWAQWPGWGQTDVDKILKADEESSQQLSFLE